MRKNVSMPKLGKNTDAEIRIKKVANGFTVTTNEYSSKAQTFICSKKADVERIISQAVK